MNTTDLGSLSVDGLRERDVNVAQTFVFEEAMCHEAVVHESLRCIGIDNK
jgi:hypothetical protein